MFIWAYWSMMPRQVRKWIALILGLPTGIVAPFVGYLAGADIERVNEQGLATSPGITPEQARNMTWDWSTILFWGGLIFGVILILVVVLYSITEESEKSPW